MSVEESAEFASISAPGGSIAGMNRDSIDARNMEAISIVEANVAAGEEEIKESDASIRASVAPVLADATQADAIQVNAT